MSAEADHSFFGIHENIILTKNGIWLSNGEEITHQGTVRAFSKNIHRCADGFEIILGTERKVIHVEDTFFFVTGMDGAPEAGYSIRLSDGRTVPLQPETLQYQPGRLTCRVQNPNGSTTEEAKFLSSAYYEILNHIERDDHGFYITIQKKKISLG